MSCSRYQWINGQRTFQWITEVVPTSVLPDKYMGMGMVTVTACARIWHGYGHHGHGHGHRNRHRHTRGHGHGHGFREIGPKFSEEEIILVGFYDNAIEGFMIRNGIGDMFYGDGDIYRVS
jgi:hypothetical protein